MPRLTPVVAVAATFLAFGSIMGLWVGSVPTVQARAGLDPATLGLSFTLFTVVYIAGMSGSGPLARFMALRTQLLVAVPAQALALTVLLHSGSTLAFMVAIAVFGLIGGLLDAVMNTEATQVERDTGRTVLARIHGMASFGLGVGAIVGSASTVQLGLAATALLGVAVSGLAALAVWRATPARGRNAAPAEASAAAPSALSGPGQPSVGLAAAIIAVAPVGLVMGLSNAGEFAASVFSSPYIASFGPEYAAVAGAGGAAFALAQSVVRLGGADRLRARLGDPVLLIVSLLVAIGGFAVLIFGSGFASAALGFGLVGIGTACVAPCCFALAVERSSVTASTAIAAMGTLSAIPRIPMPWAFGAIVAASGYLAAFAAVTVLLGLGVGLAMMLARQTPAGGRIGAR